MKQTDRLKRLSLSVMFGCLVAAIALAYPRKDTPRKQKPKKINSRPSDRAGTVHKALIYAAQEQGIDPVLVLAIAKHESNFRPAAKNPRSSARGLGQFINETARKYGLKNDGTDSVRAQSKALARLTADNYKALKRAKKGKEPTAGELYLAHFAGLNGARKIATYHNNQKARAVLGSKVMRANPHLKGMNVADVKKWANSVMSQKIALVRPLVDFKRVTTLNPKLWVNR